MLVRASAAGIDRPSLKREANEAPRRVPRNALVELSEANAEKWLPLLDHATLARSGLIEPRAVPERMADNDATAVTRPKRTFRTCEVDEMVHLYEQGKTIYELADIFSCHRQTVSRQLKSRGVHMRLSGMTQDQLEQARQLYESGMTLKAVGRAVGVSRNHARTCLAEAGVELRSRTTDTRPECSVNAAPV